MKININDSALVRVFIAAIFCFYGCSTTMPVAQSGGKDDVAYLLVSSTGENVGKKVSVLVDDKVRFTAKAIKHKHDYEKGTAYQIIPGKRHVTVRHDGKTLYNGVIFISQQETKIIQIP
jgi:hypothetical protein